MIATWMTLWLLVTLVAQAVWPHRRLVLVVTSAGIACAAASAAGVTTAHALVAAVPWEVLILLVTLGQLSEVLASSGLFQRLAVTLAQASGGRPGRLVPWVAALMWLVSSLVNNLTALLLMLPMLLALLSLLGVHQRYVSWTLGLTLVACNLGGAASPIGDFPAILLLSRGSMSFGRYAMLAAPATLLALTALVAVVGMAVRPARGIAQDPLGARLSVATIVALHRGFGIDRRALLVATVALGAMLAGWTLGPPWLTPDLVAWVGVGGVLLARGQAGEALLRTRVDVEAALFLFALFVLVGAVRATGALDALAAALAAAPLAPDGRLALFLVFAGLSTGLFSAGPSMAALLDVADALAAETAPDAVYIGLALSVCAGSSLFLTAATSGPLAQSLTERAALAGPGGEPLRFGFREFLPVGLVSFAVIQAIAVGWALLLA